ncbi:MAG: diguanylate cyclase [Anaerolineales bacterium]
MEIRLYMQMIQRGWWIIVVTSLVALTVSLGLSYTAVPQYQATATFLISPSSTLPSASSVVDSLNTLDRTSVVSNYAEIMGSDRIFSDALAFLKLDALQLEDYTINAVVLPSSSVLELNVSGPNPQIAADFANAIGYQTINFARRLNQVYDLNFLDVAVPPIEPFSPQPLRDAGIATALGLIVGIGLAIVSEQIRIPIEAYRVRLRLDSMTGTFNNRYFVRLVEEELQQNPKETMSIGIIELSGLRELVDTLSPAALQGLLRVATDKLRSELRGNDAIGRWNDYTFIVMLPSTPAAAATRTFDRIYQALLPPVHLGQYGVSINFDAYIGGAEYSSSMSAQELFKKAEDALDQSRRDATRLIHVWEMKNPFWTR